MSEVREVIKNAFEIYYGLSYEESKKVPMKDIFIDSFNFIRFIVDIESNLEIEIPDNYLIINDLPDVETFIRIISNLLSNQSE